MEVTTRVIADLVGGTVEGNPDKIISGYAKIEEATPNDLSFLANKKYFHHAATTKAGALLVGENFNFESNPETTLIRVADPYLSLARLLKIAEASKEKPWGIEDPVHVGKSTSLPSKIFIGAFAYIGENVKLGNNVRIYPQCYIGDNVEIGDDCILYSGVKIYEGCKVGKQCILHSGAVIGADGFGFAPVDGKYEKIPQIGIVEIEDDVEIGANTTIDRATFGKTIIGKGTKLDNLIQIAHNVTLGTDNVFAAQTGVAGSVHIGNHNMIGGQVGFAGHIKIGDYNEIGAQSGLHTNLGNHNRLIGYPAIELRQFARNQINLKRLDEFLTEQKRKNNNNGTINP